MSQPPTLEREAVKALRSEGCETRRRPVRDIPGDDGVGVKEYVLLALVILVPLVIAVAVTLWSLEQARYRPKRARGQRSTDSAAVTEAAGATDASPPQSA